MLKASLAGALGALALGLPSLAQAAVVIAPVTAVVEIGGEAGSDFGISNLFDQSGLTEGYDSGLTDFDEFLAAEPQHSASGAGREWFAQSGQLAARITFDLGGLFDLRHLALWNEEAGGVGRLKIYAMDKLIADVSPTDNASGARFYGAERFDFGPVATRYVTFELSDCGGTYQGCSLGEVAFGGFAEGASVPEPATWTMMILGVWGAGAMLRRARASRGGSAAGAA